MSNYKDNLFSTAITLVEKLVTIYIEHKARSAITQRVWNMISKIAGLAAVLVIISILCTTVSWIVIMALLMLYLKTLQLSLVYSLLIILLTNLTILFVVVMKIFSIKKKAINMMAQLP